MATKKKSDDTAASPRSEAYETALSDYTSALEMLHKGELAGALERFRSIEEANPDEPELREFLGV